MPVDPTMPVLIGTVLTASLVGSLHCAGMCGGLMLFALGSEAGNGKATKLKLQSAYHGGRLATYTLLGIVAGWIGSAVDFGGSFVGIQRAAAVFAGVFMVGFGVVALLRLKGVRIAHVRAPKFLQNQVEKGQRLAFSLSPFRRALTIGLLTTLLPCGWLYAFAFIAAGTGSPVWGGLTMAVFWVGTLPVMASLGAGIQMLAGPLHDRIPVISALAVVTVGVFTATGRLSAPEMSRESLHLTESETGQIAVPTDPNATCPLCELGLPMPEETADSTGAEATTETETGTETAATSTEETTEP